MKRTLLLLVLVTSVAQAAEAPSPVRDELIKIAQDIYNALGTDHKDVWEKNFADDAVIMDEFGRRQNKAEAVGDIRAFPAGFSGSIEVRDAHVFVYGDSAVLDCESYEKETVYDQKLVVRYKNVFSFAKQGGTWKITSMMAVTLPTEPPALDVPGLKADEYAGTYHWGPRAFIVSAKDGKLSFVTRAGGPVTNLAAIGKDVFMEDGDERNVIIFRRGTGGKVVEMIERRKFNDLRAKK